MRAFDYASHVITYVLRACFSMTEATCCDYKNIRNAAKKALRYGEEKTNFKRVWANKAELYGSI